LPNLLRSFEAPATANAVEDRKIVICSWIVINFPLFIDD